MREKALAALYQHLADARADPTRILSETAGAAATALAATADPATDLTVAHALGWYHWARREALPEGRDQDDAEAALRYLAPVFQASPESVPVALHHVFDEDDPNDPVALLRSYQLSGRRDLLDRAVAGSRVIAAATTPDHPNHANDLNNLVAALCMSFEHTGEVGALEEAVRAGRDAVAATRPTDKRRARYLDNLGGALRMLADRTGRLDLLREAADASRAAVATATPDHPQRAAFLSNFGGTLYVLYERTKELDVLREAARVGYDAVAATSPDEPTRAFSFHNLSGTLLLLYGRNGQLDVLGEAVRTGREAATALPRDHPNRGAMLNGLVGVLSVLSEDTNDLDALRDAVRAGRDAVAATPPGHPGHPMHLHNLGIALQRLAERAGETDALEEARRCFRVAAAGTTGETLTRVRAHRRLAQVTDDPAEALRAMEDAIDLVEILAPGSLLRADREHQLGRLSSLTGEAACAALGAGRPARAVELLERARGILAAEALEMRGGDQERLRERFPALADRLDQVRTRLDELDRTHHTAAADAQDLATERQEAHADWRRLLAHVRELPGFADFLTAPRIEQLTRHAQDGPIVFVTNSPTRGDALILTGSHDDPVDVVPLAGLTQSVAEEYVSRLLTACRTAGARDLSPPARGAARQEIREILAWLWDIVVAPVLTHLGPVAVSGGVPSG